MMAARERFIVTCTGRSIKNNNLLPLVTPLAELLDFFTDCGLVKSLSGGDVSAIEYIHPRHLGSAENFGVGAQDNGVTMRVQPWSFDAIARTIAETRQKNSTKKSTNHVSIDLPELLETMTLDDLVRLVYKPLDYYLRKGLGIWRPWVDEVESATLPISGESRKLAWACRDLFHEKLDVEHMDSALRSKDILPVAPFDSHAVTSAIELVGVYRKAYGKTLSSAPSTVEISLELTGLPMLKGTIDGFHVEEKILTFVSFEKRWDKDLYTMILRLLVLIATGVDVEKAMMYHLNDKGEGTTARSIVVNPSLTQDIAQQKLESILSVEPIARAIACPMFGETTELWIHLSSGADATPEQKFESFVENDFTFKKSDELIVFGSSPEFDEVYEDPTGLMRTFFTSYFGAIQVGGKTGKWELGA
jgi:exonuclease V gamma subunit